MEQTTHIRNIFDLLGVVSQDKFIEDLLIQFAINSSVAYEKSEGRFMAIEENAKDKYFNIDLELLVHTIIMMLEKKEFDINSIHAAKNFFDKVDKVEAGKNLYMLMTAFYYKGLVAQPKNYFYFKVLYKTKKGKNYFAINSIGLNRGVIVSVIGEEIFESTFQILSEKGSEFKKLCIGSKQINSVLRKEGVSSKEVDDYSNYIEYM